MAEQITPTAISDTKTSLSEVVNIVYINENNAVFLPKNNFLTLKIKIKNETGSPEEKEYDRVFLHRAFPYDYPYEYISVIDKDVKEVGLIRELRDVGEHAMQYIIDELDRKYYTPVIQKILSMKEKFGFSYWYVQTDAGERNFTMQDTYRNIHKVNGNHIFLTDVDGNRYDIPDVEALDNKSYRKIELYL